jgi:SAM-dependent methyltransferase
MQVDNKFNIQNQQYEFPYHYLPYLNNEGYGVRHRILSWGYEYLCYMLHIRNKILDLAPGSLLDIGCGDGRFSNFLLKTKFKELLGVDLSPKAIKFAQAFNDDSQFKCCDIQIIDRQFDIVTLIETIEHIPDDKIDEFIKAAFYKVKPNGYLLISVPTKNRKLIKKHYRHYDIQLLKSQISCSERDYEIISKEYIFNFKDRFYNYWMKLTNNKYAFVSIKFLDEMIWNRVWNNLRVAD